MIAVLGGVSFMLAGKATVLGGFVTPTSPRSPRMSRGPATCHASKRGRYCPPYPHPQLPHPTLGRLGRGSGSVRVSIPINCGSLPARAGVWPCVHSPGLWEIVAS